eukprot:133843-Prymnesium_polylepis.1
MQDGGSRSAAPMLTAQSKLVGNSSKLPKPSQSRPSVIRGPWSGTTLPMSIKLWCPTVVFTSATASGISKCFGAHELKGLAIRHNQNRARRVWLVWIEREGERSASTSQSARARASVCARCTPKTSHYTSSRNDLTTQGYPFEGDA